MKFLLAGLVVTGFCLSLGAQSRLDIDRLYRLPWIIGSAPEHLTWSKDSRRLAFLWNDEGTNFYDVWMVGVNDPRPVRVTRMPRPEVPVEPGLNVDKLENAERAAADPGVTSVVWSPDQRSLFFILAGKIYESQPGAEPKPLSAQSNIGSLKVAPKGNMLAFTSGANLFVARLDGADFHLRNLSNISKPQVSVEEFYWSNDGQQVAFVETDQTQVPTRGIPDYLGEETTLRFVKRPFPGEPSARRRLGLVAANGTSSIRWADLGGEPMDQMFGVAWSPDSKAVLVDKSDLYIKDRRLLILDSETGKRRLLVEEADPKNVTAEWWADWAPDGNGIYFTSDRDNDYHVYYAPNSGGAPKAVTAGNWAVFSAVLSPQSKSLFYTSNEGRTEERQLYRIPLNGGAPSKITNTPGTHTATVSPDGKWIADYFSNDLTPPDLYLQRADIKSVVTQVTHSPLPEFKRYRWAAPQYVTFPSAADGVMLHGRLTLPPDFDNTKRYPAILGSVYSNTVHNQWGGRVAHPTWGLDQYLAQQGYVLLNVDIRGSSGHGKAFRQRLALDYGGIDVEDLYSGVKFLDSQGYVEMKRVGIWGSSYGGLLTTMSLFTKPGVYKAGVAGAPATSLFHALTGEMETMMAPQDHQAEYADASAYLKSGGLQDHLMIIHGMRDEIVLFKDSVTLEQRLITQGKDVRLVVLPNAPHSWDTGAMVQTRFAYHQLIEFFRQYLGEGPI